QLYTTATTTVGKITGSGPFFGGSDPGPLPTSSASSASLFTYGGPSGSNGIQDFVYLDTDHNGTLETIYATYPGNSTGTIQKYYYNGSAWSYKGALGSADLGGNSIKGITGSVEPNGTVDLFVTAKSASDFGTLGHVVDASGAGNAISGATYTQLAAAAGI